MSYVKDLMAMTAEWVAANPSSTGSGQIKLPRVRLTPPEDVDEDRWQREIARAYPKKRVELEAALAEYRRLRDEIKAEHRRIREAEDAVEYEINRIDGSGRAKYTILAGVASHAGTALHGRWCLAWASAGYNVFELGNDFTAAMLLTDPRAIDFDALRLPFPAILVTIPDRFAVGVEGGHYTKIHLGHVDGAWQIYATDGVRVLDARLAEGKEFSWDAIDRLDRAIGDETILEADADVAARRTIAHVAFGMLAYVTATERALEPRPDAAPPNRRTGAPTTEKRPTTWAVGRTIRIAPELVRVARAGTREVALRLKNRWIVRGHYRDQPHGPGRAERRRIWIEPFWKGPEDGAALVHTYRPEKPPA